jgi:hypothetical protein
MNTMFRIIVALSCIVIALIALVTGCAPRRIVEEQVIQRTDHEYVCAVAIDLSGSFRHQMTEKGRAYEFLMSILKRYYDSHNTNSDKIILGQLSGTARSMLWEGTPHDLRIKFPTAESFRTFLLQNADPNGSVIHDGVRNIVDYVSSDPRVANGQAKSAIFVLSDMLDNAPDQAESLRKLLDSFSTYGKQRHVVGLYYVDQLLVAPWRQRLQASGFKEFCVEPEFYGNPPLPNLEF